MNKELLAKELLKIAKSLSSANDDASAILSHPDWVRLLDDIQKRLDGVRKDAKSNNHNSVKSGLRMIISDAKTALGDIENLFKG